MPARQSLWKRNEISKYHEQLLPGQACSLGNNDDGEAVEPQARSRVGTSKDQRKKAEDLKVSGAAKCRTGGETSAEATRCEDLDP